jgi:hypothetical protein
MIRLCCQLGDPEHYCGDEKKAPVKRDGKEHGELEEYHVSEMSLLGLRKTYFIHPHDLRGCPYTIESLT